MLQGSWKQCRPQEIIKNPLVISFLVGLIMYFLPVSLPVQLHTVIGSFAGCNAPVAMVILGVLLGNTTPKRLFLNVKAWEVSGVRLILIPVLTMLGLHLFSNVPVDIRTAILIAAAAPVGSNLAVYVQKQGGNSEDAVSMVCLSTILSAVTMPLILLLTSHFI